MRNGVRLVYAGVIVGLMASVAGAQQGDGERESFKPIALSLQPAAPESVYAPPSPAQDAIGINQGAVHFDLAVAYFTDYIYRGLELFEPPGTEDRANLQISSHLSWDLGKLPHPFLGVFVNYADSDPISSFQEIRPIFGMEWTIRPLILSTGHNTYIYPDRDNFETSDVWGKIQLDDSYFFDSETPLLSPYIYGAYDYDRYNGWYLEAGVSHDFVIEDTGLTITAEAHLAYVRGLSLYATVPDQRDVNGLQHYQFGLIGNYSLNTLLKFPPRYGDWSLQGFLFYTDGLDNDLNAATQTWGGAGIMFKY